MTTLETARAAAKALSERKGIDIKLIKITDISSIADYFVIAAGSSTTHVKSLARHNVLQIIVTFAAAIYTL